MTLDITKTSYEGRDLEAMSFANNYHRWVLSIFSPFLGTRVGEVGAGSGNFSSLLLEKDIQELVAIEPSQEMYPLLLRKFKGESRVTTHQDRFKTLSEHYTDYFDSVLYINVLEHIEEDARELQYVYNSLKPNGHVCIFVPALPFLYSEFDASIGHYRRYTAPSLRRILEDAGFHTVKLSYFDIAGIIPWFVVFKLLKKRLGAGNVAAYDRLVVPIMRVVERILPVPVGKNLIAIGRK